jgi:chaperonin cofactor prefoldin
MTTHLERTTATEVKLEAVDKRVDRLESRFDRLEDKFDKLEKKVDGLDIKVTGIDDYIKKMNGAVPHLQADVNSILALLSVGKGTKDSPHFCEKEDCAFFVKGGSDIVPQVLETKTELAETKFKVKLLWGGAIFLVTTIIGLILKVVLGI